MLTSFILLLIMLIRFLGFSQSILWILLNSRNLFRCFLAVGITQLMCPFTVIMKCYLKFLSSQCRNNFYLRCSMILILSPIYQGSYRVISISISIFVAHLSIERALGPSQAFFCNSLVFLLFYLITLIILLEYFCCISLYYLQ